MLNKRFVFALVVIFFSFLGNAQKDRNQISLKNILNLISKQYDVRFSYIEDEIILYKLIAPDKKLSLVQKIEYIKKVTKLQFKQIDNKYFAIYNDPNLDKSLCGYLIDSTTNGGIENATVRIKENNFLTFSDSSGYFEVPKISSDLVWIEHQGYESFIINPIDLNVPNCPKFKLKPIFLALDEVITQRYLATGISKKNDGTIEVKPMKFGILPGLIEPDVLQTMQQIPGIISVDETISNINVRGGTHDQNLFLWNGIRMFQTGHFFGLISAFNPSLAQTISITKNGSSAFFGESVSSLVDISSRSKTIEETKNSFNSNLISAEFNTKLKISNKTNLTLSGRRSLTDFFKTPTYKNYSDRIFQNTIITDLNSDEIVNYKSEVDFYFYDIIGQFQQKIGNNHELFIDLIAIENSLQFNQSGIDLNSNSTLKQKNLGTTIHWKTNWNERNKTDLNGYYSSYVLNSSNETLENNQILNQKNKIIDIGFQVKHSILFLNKITLDLGYQFNETLVTNFDEINLPFFSRTITNVLITHAGIVEGKFETENKKTFLKIGLRSNYFDKFNLSIIEPRFQFNQALTSDLRLEILGEQKSQTLSQIIDLQQDFLGVEKRRWTLANNTTIPIQRSNQISVGLSYKKNNWFLSLDNFYKKVTGITSSSQGFQNQFELEKTSGDYQVLGTEFLIQKSFNHFYTWLSYAYNDNIYFFDKLLNTSFPNNFDITHAISWSGIFEWKKNKLALGAKWHTGRPVTTPASNTITETNPNIEYNSPNNSRLKDYFQVNFSATRDWKLSSKVTLQTGVSILNLLNTKNSLNRFYRVNTIDNSVESVDTYSLEITPNLNVKLSF